MLTDLSCSACRKPELSCCASDAATEIVCNNCGSRFPCQGPIIDFLLRDCLDQTNLNEINGNEYNLEDAAVVEQMFDKDKWSSVYGHSLMYAVNIIEKLIINYSSDTTLYCLGSGTGFEIKALCTRKQFRRIYSSDISMSALKIALQVLAPFEGNLGLFASTFSHTPVQKKPGNLGLVFQALHHTTDIHKTLESLLKHSFTDLIIVEPTTNWLVEILAYFGLAKRKEYSGLIPSWMDLGQIEKIATQHNYNTQIYTWWEFPPGLARYFDWNVYLANFMSHVVDFISVLTGYFKFGSMSAILFTPDTTYSHNDIPAAKEVKASQVSGEALWK